MSGAVQQGLESSADVDVDVYSDVGGYVVVDVDDDVDDDGGGVGC